jgi:hypothetical protein
MVASAMRIPYLVRLSNQGLYADYSYEIMWVALWSWAEVALCIIVACTFSLPRLFRAKSNELGCLLSIAIQPFSSLNFILGSKLLRSKSNGSDESIFPLTTIESQPIPRLKDSVRAPPGLTMGPDGGNFVVMVRKDISVIEERV